METEWRLENCQSDDNDDYDGDNSTSCKFCNDTDVQTNFSVQKNLNYKLQVVACYFQRACTLKKTHTQQKLEEHFNLRRKEEVQNATEKQQTNAPQNLFVATCTIKRK